MLIIGLVQDAESDDSDSGSDDSDSDDDDRPRRPPLPPPIQTEGHHEFPSAGPLSAVPSAHPQAVPPSAISSGHSPMRESPDAKCE